MTKPEPRRALGASWAHSICGLLLVCLASAHRMQLDPSDLQAYTSGPLLGFEVVTMLALLALLFLVAPAQGIYYLYQRRWRDLGMLALHFLVGLVCLAASVAIDASTLLYAT